MSNPNSPRPTKAQRRDDARAKALELRQEQAKREKRNRVIAISGLVAALAVLAVVITMILSQQSDDSASGDAAYTGDTVTLSDVKAPSTAQDNGGIPVAADGAAGTSTDGTVVDVYLDYMCPVCGTFEAANGHQLEELRASGDVTVVYHPISILDQASNGSAFSTRAANAAAAVADLAPDKFLAFNDAMFANQPEEGTDGLSDAEIAEIAAEAGVPADVIDVFTQTDGDNPWRLYAPYVSALTQQAGEDLEAAGTNLATPTVVIDGKPLDTKTYDWRIDGKLIEAVEAAKS
ncbi:DsbA family protein [Cellulomonas chengniuliangii]|uniref:DsbA family protein n=1 Tax=Cellulomonas chengniuliangii TaxID=2968084 RepID=A0ABY5L2V0_9CELL|nr:thioredoxin domain-containing protein [Cellulomonas chengniuliangii]MCC2307318.1 DsbA family protein [Cellulomonas chengniuliangii]MCC2317786.1 DsbA family protein [Cellulomonas chengniuliangii]UUI75892.1 DsbA family protein [Cellulomonas chengniuliangii]